MPRVEGAGAWHAEFDAALAHDPAMRGCGEHTVGVVRIA
jgi:hypothetical protein